MNFFIKNYGSHPRLVKIIHSQNVDGLHDKYMVIMPNQVVFTDDNYTVSLNDISKLDMLQDDDIVTIDELGRCYRIFTSQEKDATVFITGHCNSNCIMCPCSDFERKNSDGLDRKSMLEYLELLPRDLEHICITGGEPTLKLDIFMEVMGYMHNNFHNVTTQLLTNGRSLAYENLAVFIDKLKTKNFKVCIPLHAHIPALHDEITQCEGSFKQTDIGIRNLLERDISVELRIVITKFNCKHLYEIAARIVEQYPTVEVVNFVGLETRGNCALNFDKVYLDHQTAFASLKAAVDLLVLSGINVGLYNFPLCTVERKYWDLCKKSISWEKVRYLDECSCCDMKSNCGGFFNTTLSMAKPKASPIRFKEGEKSAKSF